MKRYFLTACAIALGSLGLAAPRALADESSASYQVPFAGAAVGVCLIDAAVVAPGTLTNLETSRDTLSTLTPGSLTYFCNDDTNVTVGTPVQVDLAAAGETITGTFTSTVSGVTNNGIPLTVSPVADLDILPGTNIVAVSMEAVDDDGTIKAGAYKFEVPATITCL